MQYDNTNRGAIWPNKERRPNKRDPHFTGVLNIDGKEYQISAWKPDEDKKGPKTPALSLSVRDKSAPQQDMAPQPVERVMPDVEDINDEIPFG